MNVITSTLREQANEWRIRIDDGLSDAEQADFDSWINAAHEHREALAEAELFWSLTARPDYLDQLLPLVKRRLDAAAVDNAEPENVIPLSGSPFATPGATGYSQMLVGAALALAASVAIFFALGGPAFFSNNPAAPPQRFATQSDTTQVITLEDKTRITLGEASILELELTEQARSAVLSQGSASFVVTSDKSRPFMVRTEIGKVLVTGTHFDVQLDDERVTVAVTEGSVEVFKASTGDDNGDRQSVTLSANQAVKLDALDGFGPIYEAIPTNAVEVGPADAGDAIPTRPMVSRDERLTYLRKPLGAIVADLNRYSDRPITVSDDVAMLEMSGTYDANDVDAILRSVEAALPVRVIVENDGKRIVAQ